MKTTATSIFIATLVVSGCGTLREITAEPRPPAPPAALDAYDYRLEVPAPAADNRAELQDDKVDVRAVPGNLPLPRGARVVVAIPKDAVTPGTEAPAGTAPTQSDDLKELRASLIAAFVGAGFRVKDAGVLQLPSFSVRSYPDHDKTKTVTEVIQTPDGGSTRTTETESRRDPWRTWWASEGLKILTEDPTSLWVTDLLDYKDMEADVFFRIFTVKVEQDYENVEVEYHYTDEQLADYRARVEDARRVAQRYSELRAGHLVAVDKYNAAYLGYVATHLDWQQQNAEAHLRRKLALPEPRPAFPVPVPDPPPAYTEDELRANVASTRHRLTLERLRVRVLAEAVSGANGQVLWVGDLTGETTITGVGATRRAALFHVMRKLVEAMLGQ